MILIYSKDRPMQLHACLESVVKYYPPSPINVLYKATSREYSLAYKTCKMAWGQVLFMEEIDLKVQTELFLKSYRTVTFVMDDDLFYKKVPYSSLKGMETVSHRLGDHTNNKNHFNYTISLDGNLFFTEDLLPLVKKIEYKNPNDLEARLVPHHDKFKMHCPGQFLVGLPHNRVSESSGCKFTGDYTTIELARRYLDGERIDIDNMIFKDIYGPHAYHIKYKFR